jgi:alkaline phosphatase
MKYLLLSIIFLSLYAQAVAQPIITPFRIHAHNDYHQRIPFFNAYALGAGSIEADIVLLEGELYVAHDIREVQKDWTLDSMYLRPLQKIAAKRSNSTSKNRNPERPLQFLIDIKTDAESTLDLLVKKLKSYPAEVFAKNPAFTIVISGNVPDPSRWANYPAFIFFDGRPSIQYTAGQLARIAMISDDFTTYSVWNGKGLIVKSERKKLEDLIASVHHKGKKIRFWATPDHINAWKILLTMGVDYLGTDYVDLLANYINKQSSRAYTHTEAHTVYTPKYVNNDKRSKVSNIILMIGDGMGIAQIYSGYTGNHGALNLFKMLNIGFSITYSADSYITDSAAGGTAMATGKKTNNRYVGVDSAGIPHPSIPEIIRTSGIRSALISAGDITDATPASFYAKQPERTWNEAIALDFMTNPVDILIGGGYTRFAKRSDDQNLLQRLQNKGYVVSDSFEAMDTVTRDKFIILDDSAVVAKGEGRGDFLSRSLNKSMVALEKNKRGFFIMIEGAQIDYGGHENKMDYVVREMIDFDKAVGEAMRFADTNGETLVIVTADHETGGLSLLDGNISKGYIDGNFSSNDHSAVMVPVFAYGPHSQDFRGVYQNTAIFEKIMRIFESYNKKD